IVGMGYGSRLKRNSLTCGDIRYMARVQIKALNHVLLNMERRRERKVGDERQATPPFDLTIPIAEKIQMLFSRGVKKHLLLYTLPLTKGANDDFEQLQPESETQETATHGKIRRATQKTALALADTADLIRKGGVEGIDARERIGGV
ncbi:hypothetical protein ACLOJK_021815, partial [Asimina triloba]